MNVIKLFDSQYIAVKNTVLLTYFEYDDAGRIYVTIKVVGYLRNRNSSPTEPGNVNYFHEDVFIAQSAPLVRCDGKQHQLPRAILLNNLTNPAQMSVDLPKLGCILRHNAVFVKLPKYVR